MRAVRVVDWHVVWSSILDEGGTWLEECEELVNGKSCLYYMLHSNFGEHVECENSEPSDEVIIYLHEQDMKEIVGMLNDREKT